MPWGCIVRPAPSPRRSGGCIWQGAQRGSGEDRAGRAQPPTQRQVFAERWPPRQDAFGLSAAV